MDGIWLEQIEACREFYMLIGTAAATLMALMFVVVSLSPHVIAERAGTTVRAFFTPIIVYFTTATLVPAFMISPHVTSLALPLFLILGGLIGLVYLARVGGHTQWRLNKLPREDWVWFVGLPILSYLLLMCAAIGIWMRQPFGLYTVETAVLSLLIIGIHNAWDAVLWLAGQPRE